MSLDNSFVVNNKYPLIIYPDSVKGNGSPSQRRIDGIYGTTLAADIAQTTLLKKRGQKYSGPDGYFNNSLCPSEFQLISETNSYGDVTFTHLTIAEINGGIDDQSETIEASEAEEPGRGDEGRTTPGKNLYIN